jgi:orotidine-5'-phosphate decarboxylase
MRQLGSLPIPPGGSGEAGPASYNAAVSPSFLAKLDAAVAQNKSLVCVGLDPDPALMPVEDPIEFCKAIVEATADLVCAFKPNLAFFEAMGQRGWEVLSETLRAIPREIPVIADAKRGDIGNSAAGYAHAIFDLLGCDAATVNPYGGTDAVEPFLEHADKGSIVWCRSSNPSARDFQDLMVSANGDAPRPFWQSVALKAREWNQKHGNVGIVMGATYPQQLQEARRLCPDMPILVPGIGAQEGALEDAVKAGLDTRRQGIIVNASRSVIYASRDKDYALAARAAAAQLREHINRYRDEIPRVAAFGTAEAERLRLEEEEEDERTHRD